MDEPELDVLSLLAALQALERNASVALMYSGLRIPQFRLLSLLDKMSRATVTELSKAMRVTRATASVMVNELVKSGVLVSDENPHDRRSFHLYLSDLGKNKLQVARKDFGVMKMELSQKLPPGMSAQLSAFAEQMLLSGSKKSLGKSYEA